MNSNTLVQNIGIAVRRRREVLGFSQEGFAEAIGMHRTYYSAIERGERNITLTTLQRLAIGLQVKISLLLSDAGT